MPPAQPARGEPVRVVPLAEAGVEELLALSDSARWNQVQADWRTMLALGHGWGMRTRDSQGQDWLVASTLVLPYAERLAWISMVLVLPAWRGQGLARRLLAVALEDLAARRLTPVLDATPQGRPVYLRQGFSDAWGFARWRLAGGGGPLAWGPAAPAACPPGTRVRPLREADWSAVEALDAPAFGASRLALLQSLARRLPAAAWVLENDGVLCGHIFGREGRSAVQIGPLLADDAAGAVALLDAALRAPSHRAGTDSGAAAAQPSGAVVVDLLQGRPEVQAWLQQRGFAFERPFTRMVHGATAAPGEPGRIVLVAGPELG